MFVKVKAKLSENRRGNRTKDEDEDQAYLLNTEGFFNLHLETAPSSNLRV
jgi:hypothetical protein